MKQPPKSFLSRKIFIYFAVVIVFSAASVGFFSYTLSSDQLKKQNEQHLIEIVSNAVNHTDLYLQSYERAHLSLLTNPAVKNFIDSPPQNDYDYYEFKKTLKQSVIDPLFIKNPEIMTVYLLDYYGHWIYYVHPSLSVVDDPSPQITLQELNKSVDDNGKLTILTSSIFQGKSNEFVTVARKIHGKDIKEFKGILAIELRSNEFSTLWRGVNLGQQGFFSIVDNRGRIVYHPNKALLGTTINDGLLSKIEQNQLKAFSDASFGDKRMFVGLKSAYSGWNLMVSIPEQEINEPISSIRYSSILAGSVTLLLALLLSYHFGRNITKPIQILKKGMRQTEQGNWIKLPLLNTKDELDELIDSYNLMVTRLSDLLDTVYKAELDKKDAELERNRAELQSLQLQINPHFLYNTFENIICYAVIKQSHEITEIVAAISYMFRYSVQTQIEETVVANELKHVLNYMTIMKHRIGKDFELDVRIAPAYLLKKMVRLTLQPLIENAFQHAFEDGIEDYHYIRLDAYVQQGDLVIAIEDNGVGLSPERVTALNMQLKSNQLADLHIGQPNAHTGIGLLNVHRRIQLVFGDNYGLKIESVAAKGTTIFMVLPDVNQAAANNRRIIRDQSAY